MTPVFPFTRSPKRPSLKSVGHMARDLQAVETSGKN